MFNSIGNAFKSFNDILMPQRQEEPVEPEEKLPEDWDDFICFCYKNESEVVKRMLDDNQSKINITDSSRSTPLTISVAKGNLDTVKVLLSYFNFNINHQNDKGHNALIIAACNGQTEIFKEVLAYGGHDLALVSSNMESSLFLAVSNGHKGIVSELLKYANEHLDSKDVAAYVNTFNIHGVSPIHVAVLRKDAEMVKTLLKAGADVNAYKKDGSTALHVAAIAGSTEMVKLLVEAGANLELANRYGSAPIHEACIKSMPLIVTCLLDLRPALVSLKDKDGSSPLHLACNLNKGVPLSLKVVQVLLERGADVNDQDNGSATPLHICACLGDRAIEITKLLLVNGADPGIENAHEWTPLHHAANPTTDTSHTETDKILVDWFTRYRPEFFETFERAKKRAVRPVVEQADPEKEGQALLEKVIKNINEGRIHKIVVLTGAGLSASAGIPTYRSKDQASNFDRKLFQFSVEGMNKEPVNYCEGLRKFFYPSESGRIKPTPAHHFIKGLQEKGVLLRVFTQNVDCLQEATGLHPDYIVHAHGSLAGWRCSHCNKPFDRELMWSTLIGGSIPRCADTTCQSVIRPNVVFFGESMPTEFLKKSITDIRECDCLIIIGTSLSVYPFAGLVNDVSSFVPRILLNREPVGPFRKVEDIRTEEDEKEEDYTVPFIRATGRNLAILCDCDAGTDLLSKKLNIPIFPNANWKRPATCNSDQ